MGYGLYADESMYSECSIPEHVLTMCLTCMHGGPDMPLNTQVLPDRDAPPTADASLSVIEEDLAPATWSSTLHWPRIPRSWRTQPWHWVLVGLTAVMLVAALVIGLRSEPGAVSRAPAATSVPKHWVITQKYTGTLNRQTEVFQVADGERITWTVAPSTSPANFCIITLHTRDGTRLAVVADTAYLGSGKQGEYVIHGAKDVYLLMVLLNTKYTVTVEALE